jgi:hypothetical protein
MGAIQVPHVPKTFTFSLIVIYSCSCIVMCSTVTRTFEKRIPQFRASALLFFFNFKSETTSAIDRRDFYQIVKNKSIVERNITDSALPCSSMKQVNFACED